jgi:NADH-quinone oxidoreductase subunit I
MTKTYDYSEYDIHNMIYHFTDLSPEKAEQKKKEFEEKQKEKEKAKAEANKEKMKTEDTSAKDPSEKRAAQPKKVVFKPVIKPPAPKRDPGEGNE